MKIVAIIARILLGLMFVFFGLNGFLNFLKAPLPGGDAGAFIGALFHSHYLYLIAGTQLLAGVLLLINQYVIFALTLLGAMLANIITYHLTMEPGQAQLAILATVLWLILAWWYRAQFATLFARKSV